MWREACGWRHSAPDQSQHSSTRRCGWYVALAGRDIGLLVERGAGLRARFLDGYETVPWPVYWLAYQEGVPEGAREGGTADRQAGVLRYCGAGPDERIHDYEIDRVA